MQLLSNVQNCQNDLDAVYYDLTCGVPENAAYDQELSQVEVFQPAGGHQSVKG